MDWLRSALKIYRALLYAYPAEFRHEYGGEMERFFEDRLSDGPPVKVWRQALADIVVSAPRERWHILAGDIGYGVRLLRKAPLFTAAAILTISVGVGATASIFSLLNAVLLRSLPYGNADRLAYIWTPNIHFKAPVPRELGPANSVYYAWLRLTRSFSEIALIYQTPFDLATDRGTERIGGLRVSGSFFRTLEAYPVLGRAVTADDDQPGHEAVAVIADSLWRTRFAADPAVLEKSLRLSGKWYRIVGVMPPGFEYPRKLEIPYGNDTIRATQVWTPLALTAKEKAPHAGEIGDGVAIGRLRSGVAFETAQNELAPIMERIGDRGIFHDGGWRALVKPFEDTVLGEVRPQLLLLFGASALVLLISCGNVANLLLVRAAGRSHETVTRSALGASRPRLFRQAITESLMLALGGAVLGVVFAFAGVRILFALNPGDIPRIEETSIDLRVLLFTIAVSLVTGLLFGAAPAIAAMRANVALLLRRGGKGSAGTSVRMREALIVFETALSIALLIATGLLIRSYLKLNAAGAGFVSSAVTTSIFAPPQSTTREARQNYFARVLDAVRRLPSIESAGFISNLPLSHSESVGAYEVEGFANRRDQLFDDRRVTPGYFDAMRIPLIAGRIFDGWDGGRDSHAVIVSQAFAHRYFPGSDPIGRHIRNGFGDPNNVGPWLAVAGVVGDVRNSSLEESPRPMIYHPFSGDTHAFLTIRSSLPVSAAEREIERAVRRLDPSVHMTPFQTMGELISDAGARRRFQTVLLIAFGGAALFLTAIGIYGLIAYSVRQRSAEIGIRMALGATRARIVSAVVMRGVGLVVIGLAPGLAAAFAFRRAIESWLYGVAPADPATFVFVPMLLLTVSTLACAVPAWKATAQTPAALIPSGNY